MTWFRDADGNFRNAGPDAHVERVPRKGGREEIMLYLAVDTAASSGYLLAGGASETVGNVMDKIEELIGAKVSVINARRIHDRLRGGD